MRSIPIFYRPEMVADSGGYSPSPGKARWFVDRCSNMPVTIVSPRPADHSQIALAHHNDYVDGVMTCQLDNGFGNARPDVAAALPFQVGSMIDASSWVTANRDNRVACSPTSGFHHARFASGHGFCTFNGLIIAAQVMLATGRARRVGILDLDHHDGDGTQEIIRSLNLRDKVQHWSSGFTFNSPSQADMLLRSLTTKVKMFADCDLLLYQAGADQHVDDPLGGIFTSEQLAQRDRSVFWAAREYRIPLVWNLAGGYRRGEDGGISPVIDIHAETMRQCVDIYINEGDLKP